MFRKSPRTCSRYLSRTTDSRTANVKMKKCLLSGEASNYALFAMRNTMRAHGSCRAQNFRLIDVRRPPRLKTAKWRFIAYCGKFSPFVTSILTQSGNAPGVGRRHPDSCEILTLEVTPARAVPPPATPSCRTWRVVRHSLNSGSATGLDEKQILKSIEEKHRQKEQFDKRTRPLTERRRGSLVRVPRS